MSRFWIAKGAQFDPFWVAFRSVFACWNPNPVRVTPTGPSNGPSKTFIFSTFLQGCPPLPHPGPLLGPTWPQGWAPELFQRPFEGEPGPHRPSKLPPRRLPSHFCDNFGTAWGHFGPFNPSTLLSNNPSTLLANNLRPFDPSAQQPFDPTALLPNNPSTPFDPSTQQLWPGGMREASE